LAILAIFGLFGQIWPFWDFFAVPGEGFYINPSRRGPAVPKKGLFRALPGRPAGVAGAGLRAGHEVLDIAVVGE